MRNIPSITALALLAVALLASCAKSNENPDVRDGRADEPEREMIASIESQAGNIGRSIVDLAAVRSALQSLTASSQVSDTAGLRSADESLGERIDGLKGFVEGDLKSRSNSQWLEATLATLGQYEATCTAVAAIEAKFGAADGKLSEKIRACAGSLVSWINVQFGGSYTVALADATVSALKARMSAAEGVSREVVDSLTAELTTAEKGVAAALAAVSGTYRAAIDSTIRLSDGRMTKSIQSNITKANDEAETATAKIALIEASVDELVGRVSDLEYRVQSITLIPAFDDGSIAIEEDTLLSIDCIVNPAEAVKSLKTDDLALLLNQFYSDEVSVDTIFSSKIVSFEPGANVPGLLTVKFDISDYLEGLDGIDFSAALKISTGKLYSTSEYRNVVNSVTPSVVEDDRTDVYYQMARLIGSKQPGKKYNPYRVLFNMCGDDVVASGKFDANDPITRLNTFSYDASNEIVVACYNNFYEAIDVCNKFIYKYLEDDYSLKANTFITRDFRASFDQYVAEARVLRAWLHFTLATGWHNPPLVTEYPAPETLENCPYDRMLKWCEEELTEVIGGGSLKGRNEVPSTIVSQNFAYALCGKVCLFEQPWPVTSTNYAKKASEYLDKAAEGLTLQNNYLSSFTPSGNGGQEKLFELDMERFTDPACGREAVLGMETDLWGWNGEPFTKDPLADFNPVQGKGPCSFSKAFVDKFEKGDIRFDRSNFLAIVFPPDSGIEVKEEGMYGFWDFFPLKLIVSQSYLNADGRNKTNYPVMRYSEVLLLCAEAALYEGNEGKFWGKLNQVRTAYGFAAMNSIMESDFYEEYYEGTPCEEITLLKDEKMREFTMEGCLWPDIVRWNDKDLIPGTIDTLKNVGKYMPILYDQATREPQQGEEWRYIWPEENKDYYKRIYTVTVTTDTPVSVLGAANVGFKEGKHEYFPYPAEAISKGLTQNPGW